MKTAKFGYVLLVVALSLFAASYNLLDGKQPVLSARFSVASFVSMVTGLGLITFDKRWAKEPSEIEDED